MGNEKACRLTEVLEAGFNGEWGVFELLHVHFGLLDIFCSHRFDADYIADLT